MQPPEQAEILLDSRRLAFTTQGAGPPLLLINGYAATGVDWDPGFVGFLAERHLVIAPNNPGMGRSDPAPGLSIGGMAADMAALLDELGYEEASVVGWSMGGFVAQRLAADAPGRVDALGLIATDPGGPAAIGAEPGIWARLTDRSGSPREQATRLIDLLFPPSLAGAIDAEFGELVAAGREALDPASLDAQEAAMAAWHSDAGWSGERAAGPPTLVVHGTEDEVIPAANAELLAARWGALRVELVAGAAHAVMAQEAQRVAGAIGELTGAG